MTSNGEVKEDEKNEYNSGADGIVGDEPWSIRENGWRIGKDDEDVKDEHARVVQGQVTVQAPQQQPQGSLVHWETFLHVRSVKVLLVENDDSTRHLVTALLHNCNYEVIEAANGLQAWKILEDLTNHIDIVLTEVVMPCLSGVGLLCKITSHKTRKNIPVIMMSTHDSVGLVFKCLSKGAVDFLVKPIRKNELKNLWQHVWRRCHSSSGSGSESGTQTQKSVRSNSSVKIDNHSGSNDGENSGSGCMNIGNGSDGGSGTQSSWTKQAVEVDSSQAASPHGKLAECPDSTCGQIMRSNAETLGTRIYQKHEEQLGKPRNFVMQPESPNEGRFKIIRTEQNILQESDSAHISKRKDKGPSMDIGEIQASRGNAKNMEIKSKEIDDSNEAAVIELHLKRLRGVNDAENIVQNDFNVLRHSELSAFSRYNTTSKPNKGPTGKASSSAQLDNRFELAEEEHSCYVQHRSDGHHSLYKSSDGIDKKLHMGSTMNMISTNPAVLNDKSEAIFISNHMYPAKADFGLDPVRELNHEHTVQHIHNHHHVHYFHNIKDHDDMSLKKLAREVEGNPGNCSLNRSASGSKHGSNGLNGSSTAVNPGGTNVGSDVHLVAKSGSRDGSGSGCGNQMDQNRSALRAAALTKFRQKRKARYFGKKIRFQNRKRLADQRPCVRGQFVKKTNQDSSNSAPES